MTNEINMGLNNITINNLDVSRNVVVIRSEQRRRMVNEEYVRGSSTNANAGRYSDSAFNIILQFKSEEEVHLQDGTLLKLAAQLASYPILLINSDKLERFLTPTTGSESSHRLFALTEYEASMDSGDNGVITLSLHVSYFNHIPLASKIAFTAVETRMPRATMPTVGAVSSVQEEENPGTVDSIFESSLFDEYFKLDYDIIRAKLYDYIPHNNKPAIKPISRIAVSGMKYSEEVPDDPYSKDYEEVKYAFVADDGDSVSQASSYAYWPSLYGASGDINSGSSAVVAFRVTKRYNFSSHTMQGWTYPVMQYIGRGVSTLAISIEQEQGGNIYSELDGLTKIKAAMANTDLMQVSMPKYAAYNVIKISSLLTDFFPLYGVVAESETLETNSSSQGVELADFNFIEKNLGELLRKKHAQMATTRHGNFDVDMVNTVLERATAVKAAGDSVHRYDNPIYEAVSALVLDPEKVIVTNHRKSLSVPRHPDLTDAKLQILEDSNNLPHSTLYNIMRRESGGSLVLESKDGALGPFQFMKATGGDFGMHTDDDRRDPIKSSRGAASYMQRMMYRFGGDLELALSAYHDGPTRMDNRIKEYQKENPTVAREDVTLTALHNMQSLKDSDTSLHFGPESLGYAMSIAADIRADNDTSNELEITSGRVQMDDIALDSMDSFRTTLAKIKDEDEDSFSDKDALAYYQQVMDIGEQGKSADNIILEQEDMDKVYLAAESVFKSMATQSARDPQYKSLFAGFETYLIDGAARLNNGFEMEAYSDLDLGRRLSASKVVGESGDIAKDPRDYNPFFFLEPAPYINSKILKQGQSVAEGIASASIESINQSLAKKINDSSPDELNLMPITKSRAGDENTRQQELLKATMSDTFKPSGTGELPLTTQENGLGRMPFNELIHTPNTPGAERAQIKIHQERMNATLGRGINQAFPVIKIFVVNGEEDTLRNFSSNYPHEYYEIAGIVSARIVKQGDESPIDIMHLVVSNPGSIYTDSTVLMDEMHPKKNWKQLGTNSETTIPTGKIFIRSGTRLHVRAGYSNDINKLEVIFNGVVVDMDTGPTLSLVAESFGRELVLQEKGNDPSKSAYWHAADTGEIIANALNSGEVEHLGSIKFHPESTMNFNRIWTFKDPFSYAGSHDLFMNVFLDNVIGDGWDYSYWSFSKHLAGGIWPNRSMVPKFVLYETTLWEILQEMEGRHPGSYMKVADYEDRSTLFYGTKEQLYVYKSTYTELHSVAAEASDSSSYNSLQMQRVKPIADFHILTAGLNIIQNNLAVSNDFNTVAQVRHHNGKLSLDDYGMEEVKIDDNLKPSAHKAGIVSGGGIDGAYTAWSYASTYLRKEAERMYSGTITVLGNQTIKAGDYALMHDSVRDLNGIIKIRDCIHHFDTQNGYVTEITPGLYIESTHRLYSSLFAKLHVSYLPVAVGAERIARYINSSNVEANAYSSIIDALDQKDYTDGGGYLALAGAAHGVLAPLSAGLTLKVILNPNTSGKVAAGLLKYGGKIAYKIGGPVIGGMGSLMGGAGRLLLPTSVSSLVGGLGAGVSAASTEVALLSKSLWGRASGSLRAAASVKQASTMMTSGLNLVKALSFAAKGTPVGFALSSLFMIAVSSYIERIEKTRQPVRIMPLALAGREYVGGIWGYREGTYIEDLQTNISNNIDALMNIGSIIYGRL